MSSTILTAIISIITASIAQILFKKGILMLGDIEFSLPGLLKQIPIFFKNIWLMSGAGLFIISFVFYILTLSKLKLNLAYPVMVSAGIILVVIGSWFFLGESLNQLQIVGIIVVILGIFLLIPR